MIRQEDRQQYDRCTAGGASIFQTRLALVSEQKVKSCCAATVSVAGAAASAKTALRVPTGSGFSALEALTARLLCFLDCRLACITGFFKFSSSSSCTTHVVTRNGIDAANWQSGCAQQKGLQCHDGIQTPQLRTFSKSCIAASAAAAAAAAAVASASAAPLGRLG